MTCNTPAASPTARSCSFFSSGLGQNLIHPMSPLHTRTVCTGLSDLEVKSHTSISPLLLAMYTTPGLVGEKAPTDR